MPTDLEIARATPLRPVTEIAAEHGIPEEALTQYGPWKAKLDHRLGLREGARDGAHVVLVTALTPTPMGEGKTVHAIGLAMALEGLGHRATCTLRQPSMGPVFGVKGGAAGGGHTQVVPMEDFNLHLTGDFHAVGAANNLLAAAIDTSLLLDNPLHLDPERIHWKRVVDINDRALRQLRIGLGGPKNGVPRDSGFEITAASEVMAILGLAEDLADMRKRLGRIHVGDDLHGHPVTAEDVGAAGAMGALLRDAIDPTLMQTTEGTLALVHTGPFANIAHGNSSVLADRVAARFFDYVVTEAGFGADMGVEKFCNIKCRVSAMRPDVAVLVVTARALKWHSGRFDGLRGRDLVQALARPDAEALEAGLPNLEAQLAVLAEHGLPVVVAINRFADDDERELQSLVTHARERGAHGAAVTDFHARGGAGGEELAQAVAACAEGRPSTFRFLYPLELSLREKVERVAQRIYGAGSVEYEPRALEHIARIEELGYGTLPVCVAKTQSSLSHDPRLRGRPRGFAFPVREVHLAAGAGFVIVYAGDVRTMPGLGRDPAYRRVDLDDEGRITGLF